MFKDFMDSRRTDATRRVYGRMIRKTLVDPDSFVAKGTKDR
jgi:hypothetical protein